MFVKKKNYTVSNLSRKKSSPHPPVPSFYLLLVNIIGENGARVSEALSTVPRMTRPCLQEKHPYLRMAFYTLEVP